MPRRGIDCVAYLNTSTYGSPTWTECDFINDFTMNNADDSADANSRASAVKKFVKTMKDLSFSGTLLTPSAANTAYDNIIAALNSSTVLDFMILNGPSTENGVRGWRADFQVTQGNQDQGTGVVLYDEIELKPYPSANPVKTVLVVSGAPVFTSYDS